MNFYHRYMADYAQKTARLSLAEHGAYTLLLDEIYSTEKPLPADYQSLNRICRAMDKKEQEAVKYVADTYFPIGEDGMRDNPRARKETIKAMPSMEAARLNGQKGGRPKKETQTETRGFTKNNPAGYSKETQTEPSAKAPQISKLIEDIDTSIPLSTPSPEQTQQQPTMAGQICKALKAQGLGNVNPQHPDLIALIASGATTQDFANAAPMALGKGNPFAYLLTVVKNQRDNPQATTSKASKQNTRKADHGKHYVEEPV